MRNHIVVACWLCVVALCLAGLSRPAVARPHHRLSSSITALRARQQQARYHARAAWARAGSLQNEAESMQSQLAKTQRTLLSASDNYYNYWRQMKRTEQLYRTTQRHLKLAEARYQHHRKLFGRRLVAMQRMGSLGYLQMFLGSRTLSDLTRQVYLFEVVTTRDAELQDALREDKDDLERTKIALMEQWHQRSHLQVVANKERVRVAGAERNQEHLFRHINGSRYATVEYAEVETRSTVRLRGVISQLEYRRASLQRAMQERQSRRHWRRGYRHSRRPRLIRVRWRRPWREPPLGGVLKPMPVREVIYQDNLTPAPAGTLDERMSRDTAGQ